MRHAALGHAHGKQGAKHATYAPINNNEDAARPLSANQITVAGAAALAEALLCSQVTKLFLDNNQITVPLLQRVDDAL
jgi:hypothetical protein